MCYVEIKHNDQNYQFLIILINILKQLKIDNFNHCV